MMPLIRPVSDLRNNFTQISVAVHAQDEPVFLTRKSVGDMVVMSMEHSERQLARIELYGKLHEAEVEIARGRRVKALGKLSPVFLKPDAEKVPGSDFSMEGRWIQSLLE